MNKTVTGLVPFFDWYSATIKNVDLSILEEYFPKHLWDRGFAIPRFGFSSGIAFSDRENPVPILVFFGRNPGMHFQATGSHAPAFSTLIREISPIHEVSRIDSAFDLAITDDHQHGTIYDELRDYMQSLTNERLTGQELIPSSLSMGRTYYLGSPASRVRCRLYEKGLEQLRKFPGSGVDPTWVRVEVQVRPKAEQRGWCSVSSPEEVFHMSKFTYRLLNYIFAEFKTSFYTPPPRRLIRQKDLVEKVRQIARSNKLTFVEFLNKNSLRSLIREMAIGAETKPPSSYQTQPFNL